jgi:hypothetical protein
VVGLFCVGVALVLYAPSFDGPFVSDDQHYVENNPYVHQLTLESVAATLRPDGPVSRLVENYAPVHVLLHGVAWQIFGEDVRGHHVLNVLLHVLVSGLLFPVFRRAGLSPRVALLGSGLFLVHPANVESVAWISQLKTSSSLALALLALLLHPRRPVLAAVLFGLALLAKPIAAFALPVALARAWIARGDPAPGPAQDWSRAAWLGLWGLLLVGFAFVELGIFGSASGSLGLGAQDPATRLRDAVALVARYGAMATTSYGTSAFHEPETVRSWLDAWFLAGAAGLGAIGWRALVVLRRRTPELVFWVWAGAAYFPVSQAFPFPFPMADRYLYFVLPGLYGALAFALPELALRLAHLLPKAWLARAGLPARVAQLATLGLVALGLTFAVRSHDRARLWSSRALLLGEAARNYPHGKAAGMLRARQAALAGNAELAIAELRPLVRQGYNRFDVLLTDGAYAPIRSDVRFQRLLREMATWWIHRLRERDSLTQPDLYMIALSHGLRGETPAAIRALHEALEMGGPFDERIRVQLRDLGAEESRE